MRWRRGYCHRHISRHLTLLVFAEVLHDHGFTRYNVSRHIRSSHRRCGGGASGGGASGGGASGGVTLCGAHSD